MARFRGIVIGGKDKASRLGNRVSGMTVECIGWNIGVKVVASVDSKGGDIIKIYKTGGSNQDTPTKLVEVIKSKE